MVTIENVVEVVKKDQALAKLIQNATGKESLMSIGFDSLDVMMLSHTLGEEYGIELEIKKHNSLDDIVNLINSTVSAKEA